MIHTATQNAKFTKLVRRVRSALPGLPVDPATVAVGLLERMWHFTLSSAKRGDIGQHDDELIAEACGWLGDPEELVAMLVETGWLDRCPTHRLLVHDWADHAPAYLRKNIDRAGGFLGRADKRAHNGSAEPGCERITAQLSNGAAQLSQDARTPNQTKQNKTQPNQQAASAASAELPASSSAAAPECDLFGEPVELEQPADPQWTFPVVRQAHDPPAATSWQLPASKLAEYEAAYGDHLDVRLELIRARQWLIDHPKRRKTRGGMPAYLTKWLNSAVNRGPGGGSIRPRARRTALPA